MILLERGAQWKSVLQPARSAVPVFLAAASSHSGIMVEAATSPPVLPLSTLKWESQQDLNYVKVRLHT